MKKTMIAAVAAVSLTLVALGGPRWALFELATTTNATATASTTALSGYIDEIVLELPTGTAVTGTVAVTATPHIGAAVTLASKTIDATQLVRPRLDGTDAAGAALTSDPPWRYMSANDKLTFAVTGANTTGLTWRVLVKFDDGK